MSNLKAETEAGEATPLATLNLLTDDEKAAALRFCITCDDDEGYDVPKPMMKRLAALGLVVHKGGGWYEQTELLLDLRDALERDPAALAANY